MFKIKEQDINWGAYLSPLDSSEDIVIMDPEYYESEERLQTKPYSRWDSCRCESDCANCPNLTILCLAKENGLNISTEGVSLLSQLFMKGNNSEDEEKSIHNHYCHADCHDAGRMQGERE